MPLLRAWKKRMARQGLLRQYTMALAQTQGRPVRGKLTSPIGLTSAEILSMTLDHLACMEGQSETARLLGLTEDEVAAHRERARHIHRRLSSVLLYRDAAARTEGSETQGGYYSRTPVRAEDVASAAVDKLAGLEGEAEAARLLRLTEHEVAAHRRRARRNRGQG